MVNRIAQRFADLKAQNRAGLVTFISAGDPDRDTSQAILNDLPENGADFIELGMPFSDPMADGLAIQHASQRALNAHACMTQTLQMAKSFRVNDTKTPLILMGYFNPIYIYGTERFAKEAKESGVDGLIVVDLPPEEDQELTDPMRDAGLDLIRLITPTTDDDRLETILKGAGGFLYYVSITGITGTASANVDQLKPRLDHLRRKTDLPIAIGFGIKTASDAAAMARICDAVVIGSSIVETIGAIHDGSKTVQDVGTQVKALRNAL
ncbi:MAG: tryptophan synthase subunit alpha [Rhodospirillales bacterium]|nr:tryptophan synthase subunit alpha [Rhodospirillales bacterium]MCB9996089.1 tryptophan synthase subunit alpha [Rhodospirillales bacterium]